jgi:hypothetical protein
MICHLVFKGGKRNGATDAIRFHGKGRLCVKLIGQHPLNQLSSLAAALGPGTQGRHLHASACHSLRKSPVAINTGQVISKSASP